MFFYKIRLPKNSARPTRVAAQLSPVATACASMAHHANTNNAPSTHAETPRTDYPETPS